MSRPLKPYHLAWLSVRPNRTEAWLIAALLDGFDVHHLDGDHSNNDPANLVLIEHSDHMMLHGGRTLGRMKPKRQKAARALTIQDGQIVLAMRASGATWREIARTMKKSVAATKYAASQATVVQ